MLKVLKKNNDSLANGGIILFICVLISLMIANFPLGDVFESILNRALEVSASSWESPTTTGIAFALGAIAMLGKRLPALFLSGVTGYILLGASKYLKLK